MVVDRGWEKRSDGELFNRDRVSVLDDDKVLEMDGGGGYTINMYLILLSCIFRTS